MLSFDITDRHIRIIRGTENHGKIKVSDALTIDVAEGLIVNGHIKDIPKMATIINTELKNKKMADKEAVISISSNLIIFKELHIPKAKGTQLLTMVQNQMQHTMGIAEDYSISYTIAGEIEEEGVQAMKVLATACPFEVVDSFRKVFSMLGIALRSVVVSCNSITRIVLSDPKSKAKMPMLLVQIDPNFVSLNLYENGQLTFSRFDSIDPEDYDNSEDYVFEAVNENIFRMFQFQKSRNGDNPIQNVVFYGDTSEYIRLTNALEQMDITTSIIGVPSSVGGYENFEFKEYANAIGAMFRSNKDTERINLIEVDAAACRTNAGASFAMAVLGSIVISAAVVGAVWLFGNIQENNYNNEAAEIQAYLDSPEVAAQIAAVDSAQTKLDRINAVKSVVDTAYTNFNSLPKLTTEVIATIEENFEGTGAEWRTLSFGNGSMSLSAVARTHDEPSQVVENFFTQDIFKNVSYTGFSMNDEDGAITYNFSLSFDMPEVEEETEEAAEETAATN
ncbi:MAG: pilus assembly protein PilM [Oscillospiraceae bacterium]|nr:pilus assembly protein PilM [Oscillospiraceae bacterium]